MAKKTKKTTKKKSTKKAVAAKTKAKAKTAKKKTTKKKSTKKIAVTKSTARKSVRKKTVTKSAVKKKTAKKKTAKKKVVKKTTVQNKITAKKKTVVKKAVRKSVAKKRTRPARLTKGEIRGFRLLLMEKRAELVGDVNYIENEALRKSGGESAGDLSSMPIHMADLGTDNFEREFSLGLMDSERKILKEITEALNRIDAGTFGICEGTGQPISKPRLDAKPWARYSIKYATMVEQGLVIEGEKIVEESEGGVSGDLNDSGEFAIIDDDDTEEDHSHDPEDTQYGIFSTPNDD